MKNIKLSNDLHKSASIFHFFFFIFFLCCRRARIDNNRREYCVRRAAQLCIHAYVLRFFSSFYLPFISTSKPNIKSMTHHTFVGLFFLFFCLCENRQQPTWILRSPSCTVVHTCVCAPFFFFFFTHIQYYNCTRNKQD